MSARQPKFNPFTPEEWGRIFARGAGATEYTADFRSTTSSRRPGRAIEGTVFRATVKLTTCVKCGGLRYDLGGPHAARFASAGVLVDCVGEAVLS